MSKTLSVNIDPSANASNVSNVVSTSTLNDLLQTLLELRMQHRAGQLQKTHLIKQCQKNIARYKQINKR